MTPGPVPAPRRFCPPRPVGRRLAALALVACLAAGLVLSTLGSGVAQDGQLPPVQDAVIPPPPDYADDASWLARPSDPDRYAVDVIWVYPTVLYDNSAWLMDITRPDLIAGAKETVATEARAFSGQANLYAPFYRQMNLDGFNLDPKESDALVAYGEDDIRRALKYYMEHHNKGRPFILASHSQGSYVLTQLILHNWGKIGVEDQLIAGYLIGWSITDDDLKANPAINICFTPHQTGCFISYNSVAPGRQSAAPMILPGATVVNPLTWTRDPAPAPRRLNMGSTFFNKDGSSQSYPGFASAQIKDGGLEVVAEDPKRLANPYFPPGVYHGYDYSLFFENIRSNAAQRIETYLLRR